ncbi:MAG TPA: hypothetical protein VK923_07685 [Euzebyales bacterium]|nr:hypothetical protein [Euzebyales bacterium]
MAAVFAMLRDRLTTVGIAGQFRNTLLSAVRTTRSTCWHSSHPSTASRSGGPALVAVGVAAALASSLHLGSAEILS